MNKRFLSTSLIGAFAAGLIGSVVANSIFYGLIPFGNSLRVHQLRTEKVVIVDTEGEVMAELGMREGHKLHSLCFVDKQGNTLAAYSAAVAFTAGGQLKPDAAEQRDLEDLQYRLDDLESELWGLAEAVGYD